MKKMKEKKTLNMKNKQIVIGLALLVCLLVSCMPYRGRSACIFESTMKEAAEQWAVDHLKNTTVSDTFCYFHSSECIVETRYWAYFLDCARVSCGYQCYYKATAYKE